MRRRKVTALACLALLMASAPMVTYADASNTEVKPSYQSIMPLWLNFEQLNVDLAINNGRAEMGGFIIGNPGTTSITVDAVLERINPNGTTTRIGSWSNLDASGNIWTWERVHMVARGHNYRLTLNATAVRGGVSESASVSRMVWAE
ncbi:MAG: hypothetical protein FWB92_12270 [Oscillospiraceae bacterium]|nr:hypothetical protein [Oscillospiraceae bacterium]